MAATRLTPTTVAKPWGRKDLAPWAAAGPACIGEMIYDAGSDAPLLVKALFTAERLSVQVHPGTVAAQASGLPHGKDEAWIILAADPGAVIGLGLRRELSREGLAAAAADGSIENLLDWKPARVGDVFFAPAGTIHAIGAGLTLIEVQQNLDLTYRLYDYGRPRALHLSEGVAVADPAPWRQLHAPRPLGGGRLSLVEGPSFVVERVRASGHATLDPPHGRAAWLVMLAGTGTIDGAPCAPGQVWLADGRCRIEFDADAEILLAYAGAGIAPAMWQEARREAA